MKKNLIVLFILVLISIANVTYAQETDRNEIASTIKSSKDPAFASILLDSVVLKKALGSDQYYSRVVRLIFKGDIEAMFAEAKTWEEINTALQAKYGTIGEETYLVVRSQIAMQMKQWPEYLPIARRLIQKYGAHLAEADRRKHEDMINNNKL